MIRISIILIFISSSLFLCSQTEETCSVIKNLNLTAETWIDIEFVPSYLRTDTLCFKQIKLDTCYWSDKSYHKLSSQKGFYQYESIDSTFSLSFIIENKMSGYNRLHKKVTGKKYKEDSDMIPIDSVYKYFIIKSLNQKHGGRANQAYAEKHTGFHDFESISSYELRTEEDILVFKSIEYNDESCLNVTGFIKINEKGNFIIIQLINSKGIQEDKESKSRIYLEILNWFKLEDSFN